MKGRPILGRIARWIVGIIFWVSLVAVSGHFLGLDGPPIALAAVIAVQVIARVSWKWRVRRLVSVIDGKDQSSVRFDGPPAQAARAIDVGITNGWIGETLPSVCENKVSIRFSPGTDAASAHELLTGFFNAGIASKVKV